MHATSVDKREDTEAILSSCSIDFLASLHEGLLVTEDPACCPEDVGIERDSKAHTPSFALPTYANVGFCRHVMYRMVQYLT